ncbi:MAG: sugar transferase [Eubacterium sp.]|nr:sugar transferase [Eubacterium sp.]
MTDWEYLPDGMRNNSIRPYYDALVKKEKALAAKRIMDVFVSVFLLILLLPLMVGIAVWVTLGSKGGPFFCQERVTTYGKKFTIIKFRTMVKDAPEKGTAVTGEDDARITDEGKFLRKYRLDELPQLINIIAGDMSLVGTRPEAPKYVEQYTDEMKATLLLPAGVTSRASIEFKDEAEIIGDRTGDEADRAYVEEVLPLKMKYNLEYIEKYSLMEDIKLCFLTVIKVFK